MCGEENNRLLVFAADSSATLVLGFFLGTLVLPGFAKSLSSKTMISGEDIRFSTKD